MNRYTSNVLKAILYLINNAQIISKCKNIHKSNLKLVLSILVCISQVSQRIVLVYVFIYFLNTEYIEFKTKCITVKIMRYLRS